MSRTLDTPYRQVLVNFPDDRDGFLWHHRLLVVQGREGRWVGATPTLDVEVVDLSEVAVRPLRRNAPFPADIAEQVFAFDPFTGRQEEDLVAECHELAAVLGIGPPPPPTAPEGQWFVADTAHPAFGSPVPDEALSDPDEVVVRSSVGLALVDDTWVFIERVPAARFEAWRLRKWTGAGRDPRIACDIRDTRGNRLATEQQVMEHWKPREKAGSDSPLPGPGVAGEFFDALRVAGKTLVQYDSDWRARSGVPEKGVVARFHFALTEALRYLVTMDQLDPNHVMVGEYLARWVVLLETACVKNPKQPDWDGLDIIVAGRIKEGGAVEVPVFASWLTGVQRDQAQIMKQGRLLREERAADRKRAQAAEKGEK